MGIFTIFTRIILLYSQFCEVLLGCTAETHSTLPLGLVSTWRWVSHCQASWVLTGTNWLKVKLLCLDLPQGREARTKLTRSLVSTGMDEGGKILFSDQASWSTLMSPCCCLACTQVSSTVTMVSMLTNCSPYLEQSGINIVQWTG